MASTNDPDERDDRALERLLAALAAIEEAAAANVERSREVQDRARLFQQRLRAGDRIADLVANEDRPRTVELLTANMTTLETAGAELRAAQALALREEGMTIAAIAELFGVTRQRISALLRQRAALEAEVSSPTPSPLPSPRG
ncbi:MAG: helix-turn-helix domain-containing protein [Acidimicrobiia bacterium]|nr:helix-turn-helix domain-containing protein [Acidimicrobiia bacterium]